MFYIWCCFSQSLLSIEDFSQRHLLLIGFIIWVYSLTFFLAEATQFFWNFMFLGWHVFSFHLLLIFKLCIFLYTKLVTSFSLYFLATCDSKLSHVCCQIMEKKRIWSYLSTVKVFYHNMHRSILFHSDGFQFMYMLICKLHIVRIKIQTRKNSEFFFNLLVVATHCCMRENINMHCLELSSQRWPLHSLEFLCVECMKGLDHNYCFLKLWSD